MPWILQLHEQHSSQNLEETFVNGINFELCRDYL